MHRTAVQRAIPHPSKPCKMPWNALYLLCMVGLSSLNASAEPERSFTLEDDRFVRDGKPVQLISGRSLMHSCRTLHRNDIESAMCLEASTGLFPHKLATHCLSLTVPCSCSEGPDMALQSNRYSCRCSVHYHRIPVAYWRDRLLRVRSMGLNTIEVKLCKQHGQMLSQNRTTQLILTMCSYTYRGITTNAFLGSTPGTGWLTSSASLSSSRSLT